MYTTGTRISTTPGVVFSSGGLFREQNLRWFLPSHLVGDEVQRLDLQVEFLDGHNLVLVVRCALRKPGATTWWWQGQGHRKVGMVLLPAQCSF